MKPKIRLAVEWPYLLVTIGEDKWKLALGDDEHLEEFADLLSAKEFPSEADAVRRLQIAARHGKLTNGEYAV